MECFFSMAGSAKEGDCDQLTETDDDGDLSLAVVKDGFHLSGCSPVEREDLFSRSRNFMIDIVPRTKDVNSS